MGCSSALLPPDHISFSWLGYFVQLVKPAHANLSTSWIQWHSRSPLSRQNWTSTPKKSMEVQVCTQFSHWKIQGTQAGPQSCLLPAEDSRIWRTGWTRLFIQLGYSIEGSPSSTIKPRKTKASVPRKWFTRWQAALCQPNQERSLLIPSLKKSQPTKQNIRGWSKIRWSIKVGNKEKIPRGFFWSGPMHSTSSVLKLRCTNLWSL